MYFYLVWVRSNRYHSNQPLTYSSDIQLPIGSVVNVELQNIQVPGFIVAESKKPTFATKQINYAYSLPPLPTTTIELANWLKEYYPAPIGTITQQILPAKIPKDSDIQSPKIRAFDTKSLPTLTIDQKKAVNAISERGTYLLHGKTGSGKTRVYIELAIHTLAQGKSVIVLSPEIGLSSQLFESFQAVFKDQVITIHSRQTPKERQTAWLKCLTLDIPLVIVGPRSALFSPLKDIGLIIVDEAHDNAYKQEQLPHYQAIRVASMLSKLLKAILVLGSATPSISEYYLAAAKSRPIITMNKLAINATTSSKIEIVALSDRDNFNQSHILSNQLIASISESLANNEQSLIFLNRRGTSRLILCEKCSWESLCPNCNLPLIYHGDLHQLRCHSCGHFEKSIPSICPNCGNDSILYTTVGTKAVVDEVRQLFPNANIRRFDTDNVKAESLGEIYSTIKDGQIDILIGTQQLAKGFDLPKLSTVGILQADTNLYLPDYTSEERSFQLITQVLGRINRGHLNGTAVIQTYHPDSRLLKSAISQDYKTFYDQEIADRKKFKFPPFYSLLKLTCRRANAKNAEQAGNQLKDALSKLPGLDIEGPAPSFHEKQQGKYQWQLIVKSTNRNNLLKVIAVLPSGWSYDIDPSDLL
ncbi:MAG: replication restart helicase PriA [Candidatus Saccharimonadales bacterium]